MSSGEESGYWRQSEIGILSGIRRLTTLSASSLGDHPNCSADSCANIRNILRVVRRRVGQKTEARAHIQKEYRKIG
jgi:hypothetical protein